jgi:hypothetical protein
MVKTRQFTMIYNLLQDYYNDLQPITTNYNQLQSIMEQLTTIYNQSQLITRQLQSITK